VSTLKIGFIGLGTMGRPMALHVLRRGYELGVYARRPEAATTLTSAGAVLYPTPAALGAASDVVISMVTATHDVETVLLGSEGAATAARGGTTFVDMSTISPTAAVEIGRSLAARGMAFVDAPVSGGPAGAEQGSLTIMVGADGSVLERVRPILECFGQRIVHLGAVGSGQATKACNQLTLLITAEAVAEGLALAARLGLDQRSVREALLGGIASSRVLDLFGERMIERRFEAGIPIRLYDKDLRMVLELAAHSGQQVPAARVVMTHLERLMADGSGDKDLSLLIDAVGPKRNDPGPGGGT
jgi:2-hydroxy-3-oxopropionate reductase